MKKIIMAFACLLLFSVSNAFSQDTSIQGVVTDTDGEALIGAIVIVEGTSGQGAVTDIDGSYSIAVSQETPFVVTASYTGKSSSSITVDSPGTYNFTLENDELSIDEVVVTGVVNPKSKLESSVSVTTLEPKTIQQSAPRTTAEIFRTIPGIRSEASGGDGNTNITVRGVPISAGGSKYLQLQEDGLPIFLYGDIAFATSDIFLRADNNLARLEAIRGGSASTQSSNSPAGIINFISKTGYVEGGSIGTSFGVDYNSFRTDFDYGSPIGNNGLNFHVGGFFRSGEGPRDAGYNANNGGQLKANLTKNFDNGFARVYVKHLNDRTAAYMPMPIQVSGTNDDPTWESIDGFSATRGGLQSVFLQSNYGIDGNGARRQADVTDGMRALSNAIGAEFEFDLANDWMVSNKTRFATNSGRFVAPFTASVGSTSDMINTIAGATGRDLTGASLTYGSNGAAYNESLSQIVHMFDTELDNFDNLFSDTKITKRFDNVTVNAGLFKGQQNIGMSWLWNSYLMQVSGENAELINIQTQGGQAATSNGQFAYGVPVWGNCCQRKYDLKYDVKAPYAAFGIEATENLNFDASYRHDFGKVRGVGFGGKQSTIDVNNDGEISLIEQSASTVNLAQANAMDYDYDYGSFSVGANLKLSDAQAVFARFSRGGSAKADRAIDPNSSTLFVGNPKDMISQAELGWKQKFNTGGLFLTGFYASTTEEGGFEATTQSVIENDYNAFGLEAEGAFEFDKLDLRGALTYTKAEITSGDNEGNKPRRQPDLMFNILPSYNFDATKSLGLSLIGQTEAFAQDNNELVMPGYMIVNGFFNFGTDDGLSFGLNANNLFDTIGITESEEGSIVNNQVNYIRARSITGRSVGATVKYNF